MTIREHVKYSLLSAIAFGVAGALVVAVAMIITDGDFGAVTGALVIVSIIAFVGAIVFVQFGIRCPRCRGNLGITIVPAMLRITMGRRVGYCPFCGVSLDDHVE